MEHPPLLTDLEVGRWQPLSKLAFLPEWLHSKVWAQNVEKEEYNPQ
jgi:hypothetical protein